MIRWMMRRHVYADPAHLSPELVDRRVRIAHSPNARFAAGAFVTGGLDRFRSREAFLDAPHHRGDLLDGVQFRVLLGGGLLDFLFLFLGGRAGGLGPEDAEYQPKDQKALAHGFCPRRVLCSELRGRSVPERDSGGAEENDRVRPQPIRPSPGGKVSPPGEKMRAQMYFAFGSKNTSALPLAMRYTFPSGAVAA